MQDRQQFVEEESDLSDVMIPIDWERVKEELKKILRKRQEVKKETW